MDNNNIKQNNMTELELNNLATKIVTRLMRLKTVEDFFKHISKTDVANAIDYENLELTEEQDAVGEIARLMTLMNWFQEDEQYEKCAVVKRRLDVVNEILKKYDK